MAYAQIRVRSLQIGALDATEKHNKRTYKQGEWLPNIDRMRTKLNHRIFTFGREKPNPNQSLKDIVKDRLSELQIKGIKKNSVVAIEVVVSISDPDFFNHYESHGYALNELQWLEDEYFGEGNVLCGYVHVDEGKPHIHYICIPAKEREIHYKNRYGSGMRREIRLCAQDILGGADKLQKLQTSYYNHCNAEYGSIVPIWRGLRAEEQKRKYIQKTDYLINKYKNEEKDLRKALNLTIEAQQQIEIFDRQIEKQNTQRKKSTYKFDHGSEIPEWVSKTHRKL